MQDAIKDKVAIVGMGCTKFGEHWEKSSEDLVIEAAYEAFEDAGIDPGQIEAAWLSTVYGLSAWTLANPLKLSGIPITRVENQCTSGMDALRNAVFAVACGMYDVVLVLGVEKLKDTGLAGLPQSEMFPNFHMIGSGFSAPGGFAFPAARYFAKYGATKAHLAKIAVKNHHNGTLSPKAHFQREVTLEQVLNAPIISWPLGLFDCCPTTDGAAAAIVTRRELASRFRDDYILIGGIGLSVDAGFTPLRPAFDYLHWPATEAAARSAYGQAGISDPLHEIDLAEVHDCFTITELLNYEDLGFCPRGQAKDYIDDGTFELDGELPVCPSGGLKSFGHPVGATGLRMIYECYLQLRGQAGPRQVQGAEVALAHNIGGPPQISSVCIVHNRY